MRFRPIAIPLCAALSLGSISAAQAQDWSKVDAENRPSVFRLVRETTLRDGTPLASQTGTGFVTSKEGDALTAAHNIAEEEGDKIHRYFAKFSEKNIYMLRVIGEPRRELDVAHVRILDMPPDLARPVELHAEMPSLGKPLFVLCFTALTDLSGVHGLLGAKSGRGGLFQTDIPFNPGCSGGPVFSPKGNVLAMAVGGNPSQQAVTWIRSIADIATHFNLNQLQRGTFTIHDGFGVFDDEATLLADRTYEECLAACAVSSSCVAFSYYEAMTACFLSPSYVQFRKDAGVKSGIRRNLPQPIAR